MTSRGFKLMSSYIIRLRCFQISHSPKASIIFLQIPIAEEREAPWSQTCAKWLRVQQYGLNWRILAKNVHTSLANLLETKRWSAFSVLRSVLHLHREANAMPIDVILESKGMALRVRRQRNHFGRDVLVPEEFAPFIVYIPMSSLVPKRRSREFAARSEVPH